DTNAEIAGLIDSVVVQEMLHMAIDCNILNAIGGEPRIDDPRFVPKYPGPLPGGVEGSLVVGLAPFSKQVVKDTFMVIEEPECPLNFPVLAVEAGAPQPQETIGEFYAGIIKQIQTLGNGIFTGDPAKQLTTGFGPLQRIKIHDVESAVEGIKLIVSQGEGTTTSPLDPEHQLAHYYRFAEIYYGKKLIRNPEPGPGKPKYVYGGHAIRFDPAGVWPVIANPSPSSYCPGSRAFKLNRAFNETYTSLLKTLQLTFGGQPDTLGPAITLMESLQEQALVLMTTEVLPGQTAGPTFDYTSVNG
ncbi:MAG TPA: ferritin-like protein, partial [Blastocatellia bacterium]